MTSLLPLDMRRATGREVALASLVGEVGAGDLLSGLRDAGHFAGRVRVAQGWLRAQLAQASPATSARRAEVTRPALELLLRARGNQRIDAVAVQLGLSRRRLARAFAIDLGIPPKLFARIEGTLGGKPEEQQWQWSRCPG